MCARRLLLIALLSVFGVLLTAHSPADEPPSSARTDLYGDPLPNRAMLRLGTMRLRERGGAVTAAFSPDGKTLAASGYRGPVHLWDVETGELVRALPLAGVKDYERKICGVAISPDGEHLAAVSSHGRLALFDAGSGKEVFVRQEGTSDLFGVKFSPDGKTIATAGTGGKIRIWNLEGEVLSTHPVTPRIRDQFALAFSPDGKRLAAAERKRIDIFAVGGKSTAIENAHQRDIYSLAWSPDGTTLYSAGRSERRATATMRAGLDGEVFAWDAASGKQLRRYVGKAQLAGGATLDLSRDGQTLAATDGNSIYVWNVADGELRQSIVASTKRRGVRSHNLSLSPDASLVALAAPDNEVRIFEVKTGKPRFENPDADSGVIRAVDVSPDGRTIVTAGWEGEVRLWDAQSGRAVHRLALGNAWVESVRFADDGKSLVAGGHRIDAARDAWLGVVWLIDRKSASLRREWMFPHRIGICAFSRTGERVTAAGIDDDCPIYVCNVAGPADEPPRTMEGLMKRVVGLTFAADGKSLIAATHNNTIRRWSIEKGEEEKSFLVEPAAFISGAALHSESGVAVTLAGFDDRLFVWDLNSGERFATEIGVPGASSHCVALSPDGRIVAFAFQPSAVADVEVGLWTTSMGRQLDRWRVGDYQINALAFSPDGRRLVGGTDLGTALVWDIGAAVDKFFGAKP